MKKLKVARSDWQSIKSICVAFKLEKNIKLDYPDKHWDYTRCHLVFLDKLEKTKWNNIDDQIKDYEKCWSWEINRSFFLRNPNITKN